MRIDMNRHYLRALRSATERGTRTPPCGAPGAEALRCHSLTIRESGIRSHEDAGPLSSALGAAASLAARDPALADRTACALLGDRRRSGWGGLLAPPGRRADRFPRGVRGRGGRRGPERAASAA